MTTALVFACYDRACRPPTSGGTGGSSPKKTGPLNKYDELQKILDTRARQVPIRLGRLKPQQEEATPPTDHGAEGWAKTDDGVWEAKGPRNTKKYALKGPLSGEWIVAHAANSRSQFTRDEIRGMLKQADFLQANYPNPHPPVLCLGDWGAKKFVNKWSGGFVFTTNSQKGRMKAMWEKDVDLSIFPIGPHVIYMNASPALMPYIRGRDERLGKKFSPHYWEAPSPTHYMLTHEYGHTRYGQKTDKPDTVKKTQSLLSLTARKPASIYGQENGLEAHAESFADWVWSGGKTESTWTQVLARELGWPVPNLTDLDLV